MSDNFEIQAFLSYARDDAKYDINLISPLAVKFVHLVNQRFSGYHFKLFVDTSLQPGDAWKKTLLDNIPRSKILIILYSGIWLNREFCRFELEEFCKAHGEEIGQLAQIITIPIARIEAIASEQLRNTDRYVKQFQWASDPTSQPYGELNEAERLKFVGDLVNKLAPKLRDHFDNLSKPAQTNQQGGEMMSPPIYRSRQRQRVNDNVEPIDFRTHSIIRTRKAAFDDSDSDFKPLLVRLDFAPKAYLNYDDSRYGAMNILFGIRRAWLRGSLKNGVAIRRSRDIEVSGGSRYQYHSSNCVGSDPYFELAILPAASEETLGDAALPARTDTSDNYWSEVAKVPVNTDSENLNLDIGYSVDLIDIHIQSEAIDRFNEQTKSKLHAILSIATTNILLKTDENSLQSNRVSYPIPIGEKNE